ncbi:MAG: phytanoyl-CoA dioxygenase family protein, partial [Chloroflexota bacterium]
MSYTITPDQLAQYESDGYFIARGLLSEKQVAKVKNRIESVLNEGVGNDLRFDNTRADKKDVMGAAMFRKLARLGRNDQTTWDNYFTADSVLDINRTFLGDNVQLWFDSIFTKPAKIGEATPWHQDIGLWTFNPKSKWRKEAQRDALTIWTALDPATKENGCLQVIPGSHTGEVIDHILYDDGLHPELPRELVQDVTVDHIELEPGDAIVWHAHLWHYSPPNMSDQNRLGIAQ